jgi:hypothetical protein
MTWILPRQLHTLASALDTEALSLDCTEQSQICAQSLFVRSKPSPLRTWLAKWKRDSWTQHLSGRILRPSLGQRFADEWTSSLVATRVSPSAQQDSARGSKTRGIFGRLLQMVFDFSDPGAASLKTSKDISAWGCPTSSKTWQEWVTERRGAYLARLNAERHTSGNGCSSWPTSSARNWKGCYTTLQRKDGKMRGDLLPDAVNLEEKHGHPAPASSSTDGSRPESWATPQSRDHKGSHAESFDNPDRSKNLNDQMEKIQTIGKLNPRWVETLMGLPVGWTMPSCASPVTIERMNSGCLGMESFPQPPLSPSEPCSEK